MIFLILFFLCSVNSYYQFCPRIFLQKKRFTTPTTLHDNNTPVIVNNTTYNNNTEQMQNFIEYMKLKTFDHNELEIWDSGEIEWEF